MPNTIAVHLRYANFCNASFSRCCCDRLGVCPDCAALFFRSLLISAPLRYCWISWGVSLAKSHGPHPYRSASKSFSSASCSSIAFEPPVRSGPCPSGFPHRQSPCPSTLQTVGDTPLDTGPWYPQFPVRTYSRARLKDRVFQTHS